MLDGSDTDRNSYDRPAINNKQNDPPLAAMTIDDLLTDKDLFDSID